MKVVISNQGVFEAAHLKERIILAIKGSGSDVAVNDWSSIVSSEGFELIYLNLEEFVSNPLKNVLFRVDLDGSNVVLTTCWWKKNPEPSHDIVCLHVGRMIEMLFSFFADAIDKISVVG